MCPTSQVQIFWVWSPGSRVFEVWGQVKDSELQIPVSGVLRHGGWGFHMYIIFWDIETDAFRIGYIPSQVLISRRPFLSQLCQLITKLLLLPQPFLQIPLVGTWLGNSSSRGFGRSWSMGRVHTWLFLKAWIACYLVIYIVVCLLRGINYKAYYYTDVFIFYILYTHKHPYSWVMTINLPSNSNTLITKANQVLRLFMHEMVVSPLILYEIQYNYESPNLRTLRAERSIKHKQQLPRGKNNTVSKSALLTTWG